MELPELPPDAITVNLLRLAGLDKHKARECEALVRRVLRPHEEACFRAGMERAAVICRRLSEPGISDNPASIRHDPAEMMARKCAAAIRAEAAKQGGA